MRSGHAPFILELVFDQVHPEPSWKRGDDRRLKKPVPVWVDLAKLYPRPAEVRPYPAGWDVQAERPGELTAWLRTTTGAWIAEVRYTVRRGDGSDGGVPQFAWVPAHVIRQRHDAPARRDESSPPGHSSDGMTG